MIRRLLVLLPALGLVLVWGSASFLKSLDPVAFAEQITLHGITPAAWGRGLAFFFIALETFLAVAHLTLFRPRLAFLGSGLLLLFFIGVTGLAWAQGNTEGCGCFGRLAARHPRSVIVEDAGFLALAAIGFLAARGRPTGSRSRRAFAALVPLALLLPLLGPRIPADDLITDFKVGADMTDLAAEDLPGALNDGLVLLVLLGDPCPACVEGLDRLNDIAGREGGPQVVAIFAGDRPRARAWALEHVPAFAVASAPERVLRQYYRALPRVALLREGRIVKVWRNRIPGWEQVGPLLTPA